MKKFGNAFDCNAKSDLLTIYSSHPLSVYRMFGCYCPIIRRINGFEDGLIRCCKNHDRCYDEVKKLGSCEFPQDHRDSLPYTYFCYGRKLICSDENNACEAAICNCDRQAA
ncbi:Phospholipase A2, partial [Lemmus lemmus]